MNENLTSILITIVTLLFSGGAKKQKKVYTEIA